MLIQLNSKCQIGCGTIFIILAFADSEVGLRKVRLQFPRKADLLNRGKSLQSSYRQKRKYPACVALKPLTQARRPLLVFGCLARTPSEERGRCLLTKLGLAHFTARLFWRLVNEWHLAFNIFDALPPHAVTAG